MNEVKDYPPYLDYPKLRRVMTNADRIRAMSDEELASFLGEFGQCSRCRHRGNDCFPQPIVDWLQQPAEED